MILVSPSMTQAKGQIIPEKIWYINHLKTFTLKQWFLSLLLCAWITFGFLSYQTLFAFTTRFHEGVCNEKWQGSRSWSNIQNHKNDLWARPPKHQLPALNIAVVHHQCKTTRWQQRTIFMQKSQFWAQMFVVLCRLRECREVIVD